MGACMYSSRLNGMGGGGLGGTVYCVRYLRIQACSQVLQDPAGSYTAEGALEGF